MKIQYLESRVPLWRRALPWGLFVALGCAVAGVVMQVGEDFQYRVQQVVVVNDTVCPGGDGAGSGLTGCLHTSDTELRHLADVRIGASLWEVDLDGAMQGVLAHPWIKKAEAARRWPDTVVIRVEEHVPVLLLQHRGLYYVDASGEVFKRARGADLDYPMLTGLDPKLADHNGAVARRVLEAALQVLAAVRDSDELLVTEVSEIRFHPQDGFRLVLRNNSEICLGFTAPDECLQRLGRLRKAGMLPVPPERIDLAAEAVAVVTPLTSSSLEGAP